MWRVAAVILSVVLVAGGGAVAGSALAAADSGVDIVYVATGENFPDALSAAAAAGAGNDPVLLVRRDSIPAVTLAELNRLEPGRVVIVGGVGVVSAAVETALKGLGFSPIVSRFGGADRYETATLLSQATFPVTGATSCSTVGFVPLSSPFDFTLALGKTRNAASRWSLWCDLQLPHGAVIQKVSAGVVDTSSLDTSCSLQREDVTGGTGGIGMGMELVMASTNSSSGASGDQQLFTTTIAEPEVNTARYGYFGQCFVGDFMKLQVYGMTVEYVMP